MFLFDTSYEMTESNFDKVKYFAATLSKSFDNTIMHQSVVVFSQGAELIKYSFSQGESVEDIIRNLRYRGGQRDYRKALKYVVEDIFDNIPSMQLLSEKVLLMFTSQYPKGTSDDDDLSLSLSWLEVQKIKLILVSIDGAPSDSIKDMVYTEANMLPNYLGIVEKKIRGTGEKSYYILLRNLFYVNIIHIFHMCIYVNIIHIVHVYMQKQT